MTAPRRLTLVTLTTITCGTAVAIASSIDTLSFVETFDGATNVGDWTWGNNFERVVPTAGVGGGGWRYNFDLFWCCPNAHTRLGVPSIFTGDYRARGVTSIGIDLATIFSGNAPPGCHYSGMFVDVLTDGDDASGSPGEPTVWLLLVSDNGTPDDRNDDWGAYIPVEPGASVPGSGGGFLPNPTWRSYDLVFPPSWLESEDFPVGWQTIELGPSVPPGAFAWPTLIGDVTQVQWHLRDPGTFHLILDHRVGMDNPRISMQPAAGFDDCTGTGLPDAWEIATGHALDLNGNGIPDSCEIALGLEADCNGNGLIDSAEAQDGTYRLDGGFHNEAIGNGFGIPAGSDLIWAVRFDADDTEAGAGAVDVIRSISIAYHGSGGLLPGAPARIYLWDDPNDDGNPADAVLLASRDVAVGAVNDFYSTAPVVFSAYAIDPVAVTGSFFVGVSAAGDTFPALLDLTVPSAERSYFVGLPGGDATEAFRTASAISIDCSGGTFMIRANVNDIDNDGVPDDCGQARTGDLNGDGIVDGADLGILLAAWGACPMRGACIADLDGNGFVDGADLGILLANWTIGGR